MFMGTMMLSAISHKPPMLTRARETAMGTPSITKMTMTATLRTPTNTGSIALLPHLAQAR